MKHLLSIESLETSEIPRIFSLTARLKKTRGAARTPKPIQGQTWAMIFSKSSTRTRVSFEVGIRELGGHVVFLDVNDIQLGRGETIEDTARVMSRYVHGVVIRTFNQRDIEDFARFGSIPVINALTDEEHPCQVLSDLFTIQEKRGTFLGKRIAFFGDGNCNVARSWVFAAARLGLEVRIAAPKAFQPSADVLRRAAALAANAHAPQRGTRTKAAPAANILCFEDPREAAEGAEVLYTDVWVSMGRENEAEQRLKTLAPYQLTSKLVARARPGALVLHCLPAYRDKEISAEVFDRHTTDIFDQAENRLHVQKAIISLVRSEASC